MGMREEFEVHYAEEFERACGRKPTPEQMVSMREGDEYGADRGYLNGYWKGWQASRATLVLDFSPCNVQHASYNNVDCYSISDVKVIAGRHGVTINTTIVNGSDAS